MMHAFARRHARRVVDRVPTPPPGLGMCATLSQLMQGANAAGLHQGGIIQSLHTGGLIRCFIDCRHLGAGAVLGVSQGADRG